MAVLSVEQQEACEDMSENRKKVNKKTQLIAREIKLAKFLAGNDKKVRDRVLKRLKKWMQIRSLTTPFTEDDFMLIWKGLFFSMWMSDKPLIQEECAENISKLIHFNKLDTSLLFLKCGLQTLAREWTGIDQLRLDKFLMFVRRLTRQSLTVLKNNTWKKDAIVAYCDVISECILNSDKNTPLGLTLHFVEVFLEELAKVSEGDLKLHLVTHFLRPFARHAAVAKDDRQISHIRRFVFKHLIRQSELALEFDEKFKSWKALGFPGNSIDSMEKVEVSDDDDDENNTEEVDDKPLDPRAGRVDVELPIIKFNAKEIARLLNESKFQSNSTTRSRKTLTKLAQDFTTLSKGVYPYGIKKVDKITKDKSTNLKQSVNRLVKFENNLLGKKRKKIDKTAKGGKRQKFDEHSSDVSKKVDDYEHAFKRQSGTWYVFKVDDAKSDDLKPDANKPETSTPIRNETVETHKNTFDEANEWDVSGNSKETEFLLTPMTKQRIRAKSRLSLDSNLVVNPFSSKSGSVKKVKIDLKLNRSQEVHEHHVQVKRSPGIPFDANKKPLKPLLKPTCKASPINPFYKRKLNL